MIVWAKKHEAGSQREDRNEGNAQGCIDPPVNLGAVVAGDSCCPGEGPVVTPMAMETYRAAGRVNNSTAPSLKAVQTERLPLER